MDHITVENSELKNIVCPYCRGTLSISTHCESTYCRYCNRHINVREILQPTDKKKKDTIEKKIIFCYKCGNELIVDKNTQAVMCKYCYHRNDLSDHKVKSIFGTVLQTHGQLYLVKRGIIETSTVQVGSAIIRGRITGNITACGTVEILKRGEVRGNITCRSLIVRKGGIFEGNLRILSPDTPHNSTETTHQKQKILIFNITL